MLLEIKKLQVDFPSRLGNFQAVKNFSLTLSKGEILGVVGESGAGKSTVGNAIAELLTPPGYVSAGEVNLDGAIISDLNSESIRKVRGKDIGFIFQDPMTSLNPLFTIEEQMVETLTTNLKLSTKQAKKMRFNG